MKMTTKVLWTTKWVYDETYEYVFDTPLPDNWAGMTNKEKIYWLEQFDCEIVGTEPVAPFRDEHEDDFFEVYE